MMTTGRIPVRRAVEGAVVAIGNDNDDCESEEETEGAEKWTRNGKGTKDGNGKGKGMGKGNGKGKGIVKQTPGGDDISCAVALQLQK